MSFPHYTQLDSMDCGPTCLRIIAAFYGRHYSLQNLRDRCHITREGVSLLGLEGVQWDVGQLAELFLQQPLIFVQAAELQKRFLCHRSNLLVVRCCAGADNQWSSRTFLPFFPAWIGGCCREPSSCKRSCG